MSQLFLLYEWKMTSPTDPYVVIRPYGDDEIPAALNRLINDEEFISAILNYRFSNHAAWSTTRAQFYVCLLKKMKWSKARLVESIQIEVKKYLRDTLQHHKRCDVHRLRVIGCESSILVCIKPSRHCYGSMLVNYALHQTESSNLSHCDRW